MGSSELNNIQAAADGTLWAIYGSYTYRYNPPADLAADDSMYNYYEQGENKTGLLHLDADGKELKRIEFNQTDENGNSFYVSNFFVDNSGNVYLSDWQNVYIYDQDGNKKGLSGKTGRNLLLQCQGSDASERNGRRSG